jgi:hypothetical protein
VRPKRIAPHNFQFRLADLGSCSPLPSQIPKKLAIRAFDIGDSLLKGLIGGDVEPASARGASTAICKEASAPAKNEQDEAAADSQQ